MKKLIVVVLVLILLAGCGIGGYMWYQQSHVFIEESVYPKDSEYLDLRGTGISMDHYLQVRQLLPECEVEWDVPFQGKAIPNYTKSLEITALTDDDIRMLVYFPKLQEIDATGCTDYTALENLTYAYPELTIRYFVDFGGMKFDPATQELVLEEGTYAYEDLMENLVHLPRISKLSFPRTTLTLAQLEEIKLLFPGVQLEYSVLFRGEEWDPATTEMDLSDLTSEEVEQVAKELAYFPNLARVELMDAEGKSALTLTDVQTLQEAAPTATFHFTYTFYKVTFSTTDTQVEFVNKYMKDKDEPEIRQILDIMDDCETMIFNNCHISNTVMASIRDDYRGQIKIVWRVFFGNGGSCLTNREVIKMVYGLTNGNSKALMYCEDARFIDFGHNESLTDISFIAYMPKLEAIILSGSPIRDLTPFKNHENLYFLEIAYCSYIEDLSPLSSCPNLGMLNISYTKVTDLSPLDGLTLDRLTLVKTPVEDEEIERFVTLQPDCWTVHKGDQPYGKGWRYEEDGSQSEYYKMLASKDIFNYKHTSDTNW